jgi:AmmeMemoRadiSam system protein A
LFVISTDFSHYPGYNAASKADKKTADAICSNQPKQLQATLNENKKGGIENLSTSLCGWTSVLSLLNITKNSDCHFEKINYQNSGDSKIYGDKTRVVGYWAIAVYKAAVLFKVTETERDEIIEKARHSIKTYLETGKAGKLLNPKFTTGILNDCTGVFVSVYIKDELRGCIGAFAQEKTLNELVQEMAVSAARDRRFKSVELDELKNIKLEISVLSPLKKVESINEIELGKHGIFIRQGLNTGTFLPQVADKTDWNIDQFLGHCSRDKAGIGWTGWKNAELFTFEVIILKDGD